MDTAVLALRTVLALAVVVGLVVVLARVLDDRASGRSQDGFLARLLTPLRRLLPGATDRPSAPRRRRPAPVVTLAGRQAVGPKSSVAVVDVGGQRLVLGVSESGVSLLTAMETPEPEVEEVVDEPAPAAEGAGAGVERPERASVDVTARCALPGPGRQPRSGCARSWPRPKSRMRVFAWA